MKKKKSIAKVISVVGIVIIVAIVIMQVLTKTKVMEQISQVQEENKSPKALDVSSWDLSKVTVYTDPVSGKKAPIPNGYSVSQVEGETGIDTGLVIYEGKTPVTGTAGYSTDENSAWVQSCNRNQWVWVPVEDPSRIYEEDSATGKKTGKLYDYSSTGRSLCSDGYEPMALKKKDVDNECYFGRYNMIGQTKERMQNELESEYEATIESIKKYGGFYIGRYETGSVSGSKPVVRRMNTDINYITWYGAYNKMKYLGSNENIKSNIIWGSLWDETLQWLVDSGAKDSTGAVIGYAGMYNSTSWGNYNNSKFDYRNTSGSETTKNSSTLIPTGSTEYTKANNIYDMAGNVYEWTLEANSTSYRRCRGGSYGGNGFYYPASYRNGYYPNYSYGSWRRARVLLYKIEILRSKILFYKLIAK